MREGSEPVITVADQGFEHESATFIMAAHELKSPLALIRQLALALESGYSENDKEKLIEQIRLTSERALRLTSDVTRSARQDMLFELEPLNPVAVCEDVAHEISSLYAARGKQIRVTGHARSPLLVGNHDLLRRVLLNFSDNALHYTEDNEPVLLQINTIKDKVRLGVRDYGPALPQDVWKRLTERLHSQALQPIGVRPQSSGLGLYIASQFAQMMHGSIGATRHKDGATFYVDLAASRQLSFL